MSTHPDHENSDRMSGSGSGTSTWLISISIAVLVYLLSLGPVACLLRRGVISTSQTNIKILETVYAPLFAVIDRVKFVEKFYDSYVDLCDKTLPGSKP